MAEAKKDNKNNEKKDTEKIIDAEITTEMQNAYLDYAMSVIVSRALPDIRDGLKPVQRRIIYAMQDQNMSSTDKFHKSAAVVGEVLKKYHPHGDTSVYDAMVRMAQPFSLRYPLINGQGNFGSVDGDPPAAMRYTEAKMQKISDELYRDIEKETVEFIVNDLQNEEPEVLPSVLPNILLNGASGIAVGMATNIPPHNLSEIIDGLNLLIEKTDEIGDKATKEDEKEFRAFETDEGKFKVKVAKPDFSSEATVEDLIEYIKGPDFPTGGVIYNRDEIVKMYATGKGRVVTRAQLEIEDAGMGKMQIVVTEIPYQVNKSTLISKIADLAKDDKVKGITDLRDESSREGMRIVIELKRNAIPQKVKNQLFKHTPLQSTFNANVVALLKGEPMKMTLKMILQEFIKHRQIVVVNRTIYLLKKARAREHILQGLKIAIDNIDEVIKLIRNSPSANEAKGELMERFNLTSIQAQAILDMQLRRLAALERQKVEDELDEILDTIDGHETLLASPKKILKVVQNELLEIKEKYGDERKTKVVKSKAGEISDADIIPNKKCIITISDDGYIKRLKETTYRAQGRGGKGVKGQNLKDTDIISTIRTCNTHDHAFFFTNKGQVYKMRIWQIPESTRRSKGTALVNFLGIDQNEKIKAFLAIKDKTLKEDNDYLVFGTKNGRVKKSALSEYENIRTTGIIAIKLDKNDNLAWVRTSTGNDEVMMITAKGQSIRFNEKDARPMGRTAKGVKGINLKSKGDRVIGTVVIKKGGKYDLVVVSENGYGKKTNTKEYRAQNRGGTGILTYKVSSKTGDLVSARLQTVGTESDMIIMTNHGNAIRFDSAAVPELGRATLGVKLIKLGKKDSVASVAKLKEEPEEK